MADNTSHITMLITTANNSVLNKLQQVMNQVNAFSTCNSFDPTAKGKHLGVTLLLPVVKLFSDLEYQLSEFIEQSDLFKSTNSNKAVTIMHQSVSVPQNRPLPPVPHPSLLSLPFTNSTSPQHNNRFQVPPRNRLSSPFSKPDVIISSNRSRESTKKSPTKQYVCKSKSFDISSKSSHSSPPLFEQNAKDKPTNSDKLVPASRNDAPKLHNSQELDLNAEHLEALENSLFGRSKSTEDSDAMVLRPESATLEVEIRTTQNVSKKSSKACKTYNIVNSELTRYSKCVFSSIVSPHEFYVHNDVELIELLQTNINDELREVPHSNAYTNKIEAKKNIGKFCFIYKDIWYRAEVHDWRLNQAAPNPNCVDLQLIDFGTKFLWPYNHLVPMNEFFAQCPKGAIKCKLSLIDLPNDVSVWTKECIECFTDFSGIEANPKSIFKVVFFQPLMVDGDLMYGVDLELHNGEDNMSLSKLMVAKSFATDKIFQDESITLSDYDLQLEEQNINELVIGYDAKDLERICRHTNPDGKGCFKGSRCHLEHRLLFQDDGFTTDKQYVYCESSNKMQLPSSDETVVILITECISICRYYVQILRNRSGIYDEKLEKLRTLMNDKKSVVNYQSFKIPCGLGEIVMAYHDNEWHRATVLTLENECGQIEVFLVDYGRKCNVNLKNLREMPNHLLHFLPFQAIECELNGYQVKKPHNTKKAKDFWQDHIYMKTFYANFIDPYNLPVKANMCHMDYKQLNVTLLHFGFIVAE